MIRIDLALGPKNGEDGGMVRGDGLHIWHSRILWCKER
jgi:hypothetical protein